MLEKFSSQVMWQHSLLVLEENLKTFQKVVLNSQVSLTCVSSDFDPSSLSDSADGEGRRGFKS